MYRLHSVGDLDFNYFSLITLITIHNVLLLSMWPKMKSQHLMKQREGKQRGGHVAYLEQYKPQVPHLHSTHITFLTLAVREAGKCKP